MEGSAGRRPLRRIRLHGRSRNLRSRGRVQRARGQGGVPYAERAPRQQQVGGFARRLFRLPAKSAVPGPVGQFTARPGALHVRGEPTPGGRRLVQQPTRGTARDVRESPATPTPRPVRKRPHRIRSRTLRRVGYTGSQTRSFEHRGQPIRMWLRFEVAVES